MNTTIFEIQWPNGKSSKAMAGEDWLTLANQAGIELPTGCLSGSCGACEIEVNGKVIRACISNINPQKETKLKVEFYQDPYW